MKREFGRCPSSSFLPFGKRSAMDRGERGEAGEALGLGETSYGMEERETRV